MESVPCATCGNDLPPQKPGARRLAHAGTCTDIRKRAMARAVHQARYADQREVILERGRIANRAWRERNRESEIARRAAWREANRERMAQSNRAYRLANPDRVRAKNNARRARMLGAFVEMVDPEVLWVRCGGVCGICGEPIDRDLPWPHPQSKTLDHIRPLARGGEHSYANSQLAHAICNSRKNDSLV